MINDEFTAELKRIYDVTSAAAEQMGFDLGQTLKFMQSMASNTFDIDRLTDKTVDDLYKTLVTQYDNYFDAESQNELVRLAVRDACDTIGRENFLRGVNS